MWYNKYKHIKAVRDMEALGLQRFFPEQLEIKDIVICGQMQKCAVPWTLMGLTCKMTAAYDYFNRLTKQYVTPLESCSPEQKQLRKNIKKYIYIS